MHETLLNVIRGKDIQKFHTEQCWQVETCIMWELLSGRQNEYSWWLFRTAPLPQFILGCLQRSFTFVQWCPVSVIKEKKMAFEHIAKHHSLLIQLLGRSWGWIISRTGPIVTVTNVLMSRIRKRRRRYVLHALYTHPSTSVGMFLYHKSTFLFPRFLPQCLRLNWCFVPGCFYGMWAEGKQKHLKLFRQNVVPKQRDLSLLAQKHCCSVLAFWPAERIQCMKWRCDRTDHYRACTEADTARKNWCCKSSRKLHRMKLFEGPM